MTAAVAERPVLPRTGRTKGGAPARRAVIRWAWRMFRREWRRQTLILALLSVAVAATAVGLAIVSNAVQLGADPTFGTANTILTLPGSDAQLAADLAAAQSRIGIIDIVSHQQIPVPGSITPIDLRAEDPAGLYVHVTLRLDAGHFPTGSDQVAVTGNVAKTFDLHVGSVWSQGGRDLQVVGLVENPLNLLDSFALMAPGQVNPPASVSIFVNASQSTLQSFRLPSGQGLSIAGRGTASQTAAEALVLVLATIGLLFVGLLAVAGFAVIAQRRLRSLGMLSSLGATDRHVRLVMLANGAAVGVTSAVIGAAIGLGAWIALAPSLQSTVQHRIDRFHLPWWAIATDLVLAIVTAIVAAWWPARAAARIPIVVALSGRPPRPQPARRFAAAGGLLLAGGLVLLAFAHQHKAPFIISGTIASVVGLLLMAPLAIQAIAKMAGRAPFAVRLALRDLARYQARSGAALGAATLAVAIAATIAISAAAAEAPATLGNLPANQLKLYLAASGGGPGFGLGNPTPVVTAAQEEALQTRVDQLASALNAQSVLPLEAAISPDSLLLPPQPGPGGQTGGQVTATLAHVKVSGRGEEVNPVAQLYVATPALLAHFGIQPRQVNPAADVISSQTGLGGLEVFIPTIRDKQGGSAPGTSGATLPNIQTFSQLPGYTSDPTTLLTSHGLETFGLQAAAGGWVIQVGAPLTSAQIATARKMAAAAGLSVETKTAQKTLAPLRNWSTAAGILVALGVLAMTVGLIRSETANDLRTLTASGASSTTRRAITGATAGALALLGALLGTAGAYAALLAWHRSDLHPLTRIPIANLVIIVAALPLIATTGGWLLAGREPPAIARRPLE
jgi:putative ABC transport system permease protein